MTLIQYDFARDRSVLEPEHALSARALCIAGYGTSCGRQGWLSHSHFIGCIPPQSLQALERLHAAECLMQLLEFLLMAVMEMNFVISASGENSPSVIPTFNRKYSVKYSARRGNFCKLGACKMSWIGTG